MATERRSVRSVTWREEEGTSSGHPPLVLQSETVHIVQGSVEGEVDTVCALVCDVKPDEEQLLQTLHSELDLSADRSRV